MTANELRQKYFDFFKDNNHVLISSASLIPENDPTTLFITAGMHPLVPYLMGEKHPSGNRLVNVQKCIRTSDIDEVGDTTHHTFFEMLGNWSLGDYFKKEAVDYSWKFLTETLKLEKEKIAVSVFEGDNDAPEDTETYKYWLQYIPKERIQKLDKKENWWGPAGQTGPCGPDSEMFYWIGKGTPDSFDPEDSNWFEIWNDVFMEYNKTAEGKCEPLSQKNIDTGMGLERTLAVLNRLDDNYKTELWLPIIQKIEELSNKKYGENEEITRVMRIVADHVKASIFIMGDEKGIAPSNVDQGYVVRRLIRRAIRYGKQLGIDDNDWLNKITEIVIDIYKEAYNELEKNKEFIVNNLKEEEAKFLKTLVNGEKKIEGDLIDGETAFNLFQTYGYPVEMTIEIAEEKGIKLSSNFQKEFDEAMAKHQSLSRTASAGKFKGGLADAGEETIKLHTTAHILLASLRKVLGDHVNQRGSNINAERLRFDFSHDKKMTDEEKQKVEDLVNEAIEKDLFVSCEEMTVKEAKEKGATGVFDSKYGEKIKVYKVCKGENMFSYEICGGPHVERTGILGKFKIKKEQSSSSGVRRIKAILE